MLPLLLCLLCVAPGARAEFGSEERIRSLFPFEGGIERVSYLQKRAEFGPGPKLLPGDRAFHCAGGRLHAATPGQFTKSYHVDALLMYAPHRIPGDRKGRPRMSGVPGSLIGNESVCKMPASASVTPMGESSPFPGARRCMMGKWGRYLLMSDLFLCSDGRSSVLYRGYWEAVGLLDSFNTRNPMLTSEEEHVLTSSLARYDSMISNGGSRDFVAGATGYEDKKRFLFFTAATPADVLLVEKTIASMAGPKGMYQQCPDRSFAPRGAGGKCR